MNDHRAAGNAGFSTGGSGTGARHNSWAAPDHRQLWRLYELFVRKGSTMSNSVPTVDDYMTRDVITFRPEDDILTAVKVLLDERISGAPVLDRKGRLVGMLSKKDCFEVVYSTSYHQEWGGDVENYMSKEVATIESGTDIIKAADLFMSSTFRRFPVLENGRMKGQISRADLLRALEKNWGGVGPTSV
jgi:CBS domain-containing protein